MAAVSSNDLDRELRAIFAAPDFDIDVETIKSIRLRVSLKLGVAFSKALKSEFKDLLQRLLDENDDSEQEIEPVKRSKVKAKKAPSAKSETTAKRKRTKKAAPVKIASSAYSARVQTLLDLGRAMRLGPRLHRGLKDMEDSERIAALVERLEEAGATWKDDLDGIDTSLIIEGGRGRQSGRTSVNYAVDNHNSDLEGDDNEEEQEFGDDQLKPPSPQKKSKKNDGSRFSDEDKDSDGDFGGSESSDAEAEFD